jgi:hypothetical protein
MTVTAIRVKHEIIDMLLTNKQDSSKISQNFSKFARNFENFIKKILFMQI